MFNILVAFFLALITHSRRNDPAGDVPEANDGQPASYSNRSIEDEGGQRRRKRDGGAVRERPGH